MDPLSQLIHEYEAEQRWARGELPFFSTNILDQLTCGYGALDDMGFWQFPLHPAEDYLEQVREKRLRKQLTQDAQDCINTINSQG